MSQPNQPSADVLLPGDGQEPKFVGVVFDGPPSHESGRFVECEYPAGRGIRIGEWIDRGDGYWTLRINLAAASPAPAVDPIPLGCSYNPIVSRVCERGTSGCEQKHSSPAVDGPQQVCVHAAYVPGGWHKDTRLSDVAAVIKEGMRVSPVSEVLITDIGVKPSEDTWPAPDLGRLRELVEKWRKNAAMLDEGNKSEGFDTGAGMQHTCADELDAHLTAITEGK